MRLALAGGILIGVIALVAQENPIGAVVIAIFGVPILIRFASPQE